MSDKGDLKSRIQRMRGAISNEPATVAERLTNEQKQEILDSATPRKGRISPGIYEKRSVEDIIFGEPRKIIYPDTPKQAENPLLLKLLNEGLLDVQEIVPETEHIVLREKQKGYTAGLFYPSENKISIVEYAVDPNIRDEKLKQELQEKADYIKIPGIREAIMGHEAKHKWNHSKGLTDYDYTKTKNSASMDISVADYERMCQMEEISAEMNSILMQRQRFIADNREKTKPPYKVPEYLEKHYSEYADKLKTGGIDPKNPEDFNNEMRAIANEALRDWHEIRKPMYEEGLHISTDRYIGMAAQKNMDIPGLSNAETMREKEKIAFTFQIDRKFVDLTKFVQPEQRIPASDFAAEITIEKLVEEHPEKFSALSFHDNNMLHQYKEVAKNIREIAAYRKEFKKTGNIPEGMAERYPEYQSLLGSGENLNDEIQLAAQKRWFTDRENSYDAEAIDKAYLEQASAEGKIIPLKSQNQDLREELQKVMTVDVDGKSVEFDIHLNTLKLRPKKNEAWQYDTTQIETVYHSYEWPFEEIKAMLKKTAPEKQEEQTSEQKQQPLEKSSTPAPSNTNTVALNARRQMFANALG